MAGISGGAEHGRGRESFNKFSCTDTQIKGVNCIKEFIYGGPQ